MMDAFKASFYPIARTAHLERLGKSLADVLYYSHTRLDWHPGVADEGKVVERQSLFGVIRKLWSRRMAVLEVPEPLATPLVPHLLALSVARLLMPPRCRPRLVTYAIENLSQIGKLSDAYGLPQFMARYVLRACWTVIFAAVDRIVFGTQGSLAMYREELGVRGWDRVANSTEISVMEGLPQPELSAPLKAERRLIFLGTFEDRKGLRILLEAWPEVFATLGAELVIVGKGSSAEESRVLAWASQHDEVIVHIDPSRGHIRSELEAASVLVLASRRTPTWREQIGLPILEGLSFGCTIVTSSETGMAGWLATHGHRVVDGQYTPKELAAAIISALSNPVPPEDVLASLPETDQRELADHWLFRT